MVPKYTITGFRAVETPITQPVTKFGGQPVWLAAPEWPVSRATGLPMRFICQVALDEPVFGSLAGRMAYIFLTDNDDPALFVDNTWDAEGGENAVIIQPGGTVEVPCRPLETGPTLYTQVADSSTPDSVDLAVDLAPDLDPDMLDDAYGDGQEEAAASALHWEHVDDNKIGGTPAFLQGSEYPLGEDARLLLQLNAPEDNEFSINLGDAGVAYAFISADGMRGKLLWQCV